VRNERNRLQAPACHRGLWESLSLLVDALQDRAVTAAHGGVPVEIHFRIDNLVKA